MSFLLSIWSSDVPKPPPCMLGCPCKSEASTWYLGHISGWGSWGCLHWVFSVKAAVLLGDGSGCEWMWLVFIVLFQQHHFSPILAFCGWGRAAWTAELRLSQNQLNDPKHSSKYSFCVHCRLQNICFLNCYNVLLFNLLVYSASSLAMPRTVFSFSLTNTF